MLVKTKAYLSSSCMSDPRLQREGLCYSSTVRCSLQLRSPCDSPAHTEDRNARSLANKTFLLNDFFISRLLDFLCLTEMCIHAGESIAFSEILPLGCTFLSSPQTTGKVGWAACVYKSSFHCRQITSVTFSSFELQFFLTQLLSSHVVCSGVPSSKI